MARKYGGGTVRPGLYLMVFIVLLKSCATDRAVQRIEARLDAEIPRQDGAIQAVAREPTE